MSNIFYYKYLPIDEEDEDKNAFIIDVTNLKYVTCDTTEPVDTINITFKDDTNLEIQIHDAILVLDTLYEFWHKYLAQKEAHEQYKPDGVGYMEAKTEFETLKNT